MLAPSIDSRLIGGQNADAHLANGQTARGILTHPTYTGGAVDGQTTYVCTDAAGRTTLVALDAIVAVSVEVYA